MDETTNSCLNIDDLDDDVLLITFSYLDFLEKVRIRMVCKRWEQLAGYLLSMQTCLYFNDKNDYDVELSCPKASCSIKSNECIELSKLLLGANSDFLEYLEKEEWDEERTTVMNKALSLCPNIKRVGMIEFLRLESPIKRIIDNCDGDIEEIDLIGFKTISLTVDEMKNIGIKFPSLKYLRVVSATIATCEESLKELFSSCKNLQVFIVHSNLLFPPSWTRWGREGNYHRVMGDCFSLLTNNIHEISTDLRVMDDCGLLNLASGNGAENLTCLDLSGSTFHPWWFQIICPSFRKLIRLRSSKITAQSIEDADDISLICQLFDLEELYLDFHYSKSLILCLDDAIYSIMQGCRKMRKIELFNTYLTDRSLVEINKFWNELIHLSLYTQMNPDITDVSVPSIAELKNLQYLNLNGTNVSDKIVDVLHRCNQIRDINLEYTLITNRVVSSAIAIAKLRPNDKIVFDLAGNDIVLPASMPSNLTIYL